MGKRGAALLTTKSPQNAKQGTWESDGLHPTHSHARLPDRLLLFEFCVFSVVKRLRLVSCVVLLFSAFLRVPLRLCVKSLIQRC